MNRLALLDTPIAGLKVIKRQQLQDSRGFLSRLFCSRELASCNWPPIAQINHTYTARKGTIRGMHFQNPPFSEKKLITCLRGEIWDVAIDIRAESPTFLQWHGVLLSGTNHFSLSIPEGFAHGFQTITDDVELLYCHSCEYKTEAEGGLNPQDNKLMIDWPLKVAEISDRDRAHPLLKDTFKGIKI